MTRKDYVAIAGAIATIEMESTPEQRSAIASIVSALARVLSDDNPRFHRGKFIQACQPTTYGTITTDYVIADAHRANIRATFGEE